MRIEVLPEILRWSGGTDLLETIHDPYVSALCEKLGCVLGTISREAPEIGRELIETVRILPEVSLLRVLTAPETSCRLFWSDLHQPQATIDFLRRSLTAELARLDPSTAVSEATWTALGDMCFRPDKVVVKAPRLAGMTPLDFESPHATKLALEEGRQILEIWDKRGFTGIEKQQVLQRLSAATDAIRETSPITLSFVGLFTKVLVLRKRAAPSPCFCSRSPEKFIGLSVFENPHLSGIDEVELSEAVVHEAIHTFLGIDETLRRWGPVEERWVLKDGLYDGVPRTSSPWTGKALALPTYIHACFVWYGLLRFWCLAYTAASFDRTRVKECISRAAFGFLRGSLRDRLGIHQAALSPALLVAIEEMQMDVLEVWAGLHDAIMSGSSGGQEQC